MGACQFKVRSTGKTVEEAYRRACEIAEDECGHQDGYNGTISTTHSFRDETETYKKSKFDDVSAYIHSRFDSHAMNKRDCSAICVKQPVGNKNKTKSQVEHIVTPGTKKWVLKYVVQRGDHVIGSWNTKGDAIKDARKYTENNQIPTSIVMKKYLEKGDNTVAKITYKKAPNERDGEWIFFGYAAE
tara:strand:- start:2060 stop:2617 length:558 start_codon:yes stop_codon:yes gene_type:complete